MIFCRKILFTNISEAGLFPEIASRGCPASYDSLLVRGTLREPGSHAIINIQLWTCGNRAIICTPLEVKWSPVCRICYGQTNFLIISCRYLCNTLMLLGEVTPDT